jgi:hypothetical protein
MHTFRYVSEDRLWVVGHYQPNQMDGGAFWISMRDCSSKDEAAAWVSYLNGGTIPKVEYR